MSGGGADLFVICRQCGSEVSPYVTECPYCGVRLRKRAPRLDRAPSPPSRRSRRPTMPSLGRLRAGEIPGIRGDRRPYATLTLVGLSVVLLVLPTTGLVSLIDVAVTGRLGSRWWRVLTAPFSYGTTGYAFAALLTIGVFGWLLERRHGPLVPVLVFAVGGVGGMLVAAQLGPDAVAYGGNGAALALLAAWAVPDLLARRRGRETEGDLLGAGAFAVVLLLIPLAVAGASWVAGGVGAVSGLAMGWALAHRGVPA